MEAQANPTATDSISSDGKPAPPAPQPSKKTRKPKAKRQAADPPRREPSPPPPVDHTSRLSNVREQPQPSGTASRFTAHLQPYPGPHYQPVHPHYAMNGNPYHSSPSPFHQPTVPVNGQSSHVGQGIPAHAQYPYGMHHSPYGPPGYPPYPQYPPPSGMMMYGAPGPSQPEPPPADASPSPAAASTGAKRKRKYSVVLDSNIWADGECTGSSSDGARNGQSSGGGGNSEAKKRTKTQRACDSCRSRKIRCDVLSDTEPPVCQHCKQYGFECTFFLPITETRFKKKKMEEEAAAAAEKEKEVERSTSSPLAESRTTDPKVYGPTSVPHLLHSSAMISARSYETYDMRYHHTWDVSAGGDGVIQVNEPQRNELHLSHPKPVDLRIERDVVEKLVNAYFTEVAPMLPVVTRAEFIASNPPPAVLLYSMCLVAATRREVPQQVFDSIRYAVNSLIKAEDVLSTASIVNIQTLLILSMCGDAHSQSVPNALSALWIRLGSAIRMAQDLGLHRAESVKQNIELRRRLWGICLITDRWISLTYGHPYMISVEDCDARLPSSGDPNDLYIDELVRLSVLLGQVYKNIYTPAGLAVTNDETLYNLLADLNAWRNNLPEDLKFRGPDTPRNAGLLFLFYVTVNMLFWRVFMRISYSCPAHLKFCLTVERWTELVRLTGDAIDWLDANERMYDVWLLVAYCAAMCGLVQYHTFARRQDQEAQAKLKKLRECVRKWEGSLPTDHMSARRKTAEIIALLYEATQGPQSALEAPALNPTGGVKVKPPFEGLVFRKDPSRPGGGVFVAQAKPSDEAVRGLPDGLIETEGEATTTAVSNVRTNNDDASMSLPSDFSSLSSPTLGAPGTSPSSTTPWPSSAGGGGAQDQQMGNSAMVNITPLGGSFTNMNPALNAAMASGGSGNVQIMNMLDMPQAVANIEQFQVPDTGMVEGLSGHIFDWTQWDGIFSRFAPSLGSYQAQQGTAVPDMASQQQQQQQSPSQQPVQYPYTGPGTSSSSGM